MEIFTKKQMKINGGINGGLLLFEPSVAEYDKLRAELTAFKSVTHTKIFDAIDKKKKHIEEERK